jgi:hypothetical protein
MFVCEFCFHTKQIQEGVELVIRGRRLSVCCRWVWRDEGKEKKGCCCCCLITHNTNAHAHLPLCCCHERPYPSDQSVPLDNQRKKRLDKRERQENESKERQNQRKGGKEKDDGGGAAAGDFHSERVFERKKK